LQASAKNFRLQFGNLINQTKEFSSSPFEIYPNPGNGKFFIQRTELNYCHILVRDLRGALVRETYLNGDNRLDLSDLNQGIYIVHADQGIATYKRKLIINK